MSGGLDGISGRAHQVIVMVGEPEPTLLVGLRKLGFSAVTVDEQVVIWSRALPVLPGSHPSPATAPSTVEAPGGRGLLMTIADAAAALGVGRSTVYELIGRRELEVVHIGRSARVPADAVRELIDRLRKPAIRDIAS